MKNILLCLALLLTSHYAFSQGVAGLEIDQDLDPNTGLDLMGLVKEKRLAPATLITGVNLWLDCDNDNDKLSFDLHFNGSKTKQTFDCSLGRFNFFPLKKIKLQELKELKLTAHTELDIDFIELIFDYKFKGPISGEGHKKEIDQLEKLSFYALDLDRGYTISNESIIRQVAIRELLNYPTTRTLIIIKDCENYEGKYRDYDQKTLCKETLPIAFAQMRASFSDEESAHALLELLNTGLGGFQADTIITMAKTLSGANAFWFALNSEIVNYFNYFQEVLKLPGAKQMVAKYKDRMIAVAFSEFNESWLLTENVCLAFEQVPQPGTFRHLLNAAGNSKHQSTNFICTKAAISTFTKLNIQSELPELKPLFKDYLTKTGYHPFNGKPIMYHEEDLIEISIRCLALIKDAESKLLLKEALINPLMPEELKTLIRSLNV